MNGKVDWNYAREAVGDSSELLLELIDIFFGEYPKLMAGIQSSLESESSSELQRFAHTLKGALRYFGTTQAGELAFELEEMGRDAEIERGAEVYGKLQIEMNALVPELQAFVASQRSAPDA
jgi:two-component system, sensor histidine kinase and response regulator